MPGASSSREQDGPLSLAARLGLYAMLAGLVLASFTVTPGPRAQMISAPSDEGTTKARVMPLSRGLIRGLREIDGAEATPMPTPSPTPEPSDALVVEAMPDPPPEAPVDALPEAPVDALPEATPDPTPEPTPEPTPDPTPKPTAPTPEPTPKPTAPPTPRPVAPPVVVVSNPTAASAELRMLELMNAARARAGLVPLAMDVGVANTARAHSAVEAQVRYVYHDGPDGTARSRDVPACGTGWYGENTGRIWNGNVDALHIEFMNEPWAPINHRTNIMDPAFRRVGVGAVIGPDAMYMTTVFCR